MQRGRYNYKVLRTLPLAVMAIAVVSCATMGTPEGGPKDVTPPVVVSTNPPQGTLNFSGKKVTLTMNKNVELDQAFSKVIISPAQKENPTIRANAHTVTVELNDTLLPNTTYTIDFADAIKDLNEGNVLDGFATDFSTGDFIDSLRISGMVLEARTLEPAVGFLVGAYTNLADSAIETLPFERITKTNGKGQFTLRNLKSAPYRLFAINDVNNDKHWDHSEDIAFYDTPVTPGVEHIEYADTIRYSRGDSVVMRSIPRYLPDDLLLAWFNENYRAQYVKEYQRPDRNRLTVTLGAPTDSLPQIIALTDSDDVNLMAASVVNSSLTSDTIELWLRDSSLIKMDSLRIRLAVYQPDSADVMYWKTDTLDFNYKAPQKSKKQLKEEEELAKAREQKRIDDSIAGIVDSLPKVTAPERFISFDIVNGSTQDVNTPLLFKSSEPLDTLLASGIRMEMKKDTLWIPAPSPVLKQLSANRPMQFVAEYEWQPATTYRLTVDSAAVVGMYGDYNRPVSKELTTRALSDYGSIIFNVTGMDSVPAVVELLDGSDKVLRTLPVEQGRAAFRYLQPGTYYARLYLDKSATGTYGNGSASKGRFRQPDEVYYFPKKINLKKNWDIEQPWDINMLPVDMQKPVDIRKVKPKEGDMPQQSADEEEENKLPPGL